MAKPAIIERLDTWGWMAWKQRGPEGVGESKTNMARTIFARLSPELDVTGPLFPGHFLHG